QRKGLYPPPAGITDIPGLEVAGEVVRLGPEVREPQQGARVCALVAGGGYAEYVAAPAVQCLPVPARLSLEEGAVLPETFFTVWLNVFERSRLQRGETLLVHGGASGIGTTAILLGKACDARVIVTAGSAQKCAACRELWAEARDPRAFPARRCGARPPADGIRPAHRQDRSGRMRGAVRAALGPPPLAGSVNCCRGAAGIRHNVTELPYPSAPDSLKRRRRAPG